MVSIQVLATPIMGFARSSSVMQLAMSLARAGALSGPMVMVELFSFIGNFTSYPMAESHYPAQTGCGRTSGISRAGALFETAPYASRRDGAQGRAARQVTDGYTLCAARAFSF